MCYMKCYFKLIMFKFFMCGNFFGIVLGCGIDILEKFDFFYNMKFFFNILGFYLNFYFFFGMSMY